MFSGKILGAVGVGTAVASAIALGLFIFQHYQIKSLRDDNATLMANMALTRAAVDTQRHALVTLEADYEKSVQNYTDLIKRLSDVEYTRDVTSNTLQSYHGRLENAAKRKPETIGRLATSASSDVLRDISRATGHKDGRD